MIHNYDDFNFNTIINDKKFIESIIVKKLKYEWNNKNYSYSMNSIVSKGNHFTILYTSDVPKLQNGIDSSNEIIEMNVFVKQVLKSNDGIDKIICITIELYAFHERYLDIKIKEPNDIQFYKKDNVTFSDLTKSEFVRFIKDLSLSKINIDGKF